MYEAYYGLSERPFNLTPDPRYLYLSNKHKEAFAHLMYGIRNNSGFVMVSGEIGTGKTTICRSLLKQLDPDTEVAFIFNPYLSPLELLQKVNHDFGIDSRAGSVRELIDELNEYLLTQTADGKRCILIIDEAQNLSTELLEQIRLLSNLETETQKLLQIILIGQPELAQNLELYEMRQLNQRITARYHLEKLNEEETLHYIAFRIRVAGGNEKLKFTRKAIKEVYKISHGTPRVINALCDRALLVGFTKELDEITPQIIRIAAKEIHGVEHVHMKPVNTGRLLRNAAVFSVFALVAVGLLYNYNASIPKWLNAQIDSFKQARESTADTIPLASIPTPETAKISQEIPPEISKEQPEVPEKTPTPEVVATIKPELKVEIIETPAQPPKEAVVEAQVTKTPPTIEEPPAMDSLAALRHSCSAMLTTWNLTETGSAPKSMNVQSIQSFANRNGLKATYIKPTLKELARINAPALLLVDFGDGAYWSALNSLEKGGALLTDSNGSQQLVAVAALDAAYLKEAIVWWVEPEKNLEPLRAGFQNERVVRLQQAWQDLGLKEKTPNGTYDASTINTVSKIQRIAGLVTDGVYGEQTRMVMSLWRDDSRTPHLSNPALSDDVIRLVRNSPGLIIVETAAETLTQDLPQWDELSAVIKEDAKPDAGLTPELAEETEKRNSTLPLQTYESQLPTTNGPAADSVTPSVRKSVPLIPEETHGTKKGNRP